MNRFVQGIVMLVAMGAPSLALGQQTLRVINTAPNDVLNVRKFPTTAARIVGVIPPNGRGLVPSGERSGAWVFVRYRMVEGWVGSHFVHPEAPQLRHGRNLGETGPFGVVSE